jgi:hypothetical protein
MSFEKIDQYIKELEAVTNYDKVMENNLQLTQTNEGQIRELTKVSKENSTLKKNLKEKKQEIKDLGKEIKLKNEELQKSEFETTKLKNRVDELENLKSIVDGMTFSEAEKTLLKTLDDEVDTRAHESFKAMKVKWDTSDKPKEVFSEAVKQLKIIVKTLRIPRPRFFQTELIDEELPNKVEEIIKAEVEKRVDEEFHKQVEAKSDLEAKLKLGDLTNVEWPKWYQTNVYPRVRELEEKIVANALNQLKGLSIFVCDKCDTQLTLPLTPQTIEDILRNRYIMVECCNPDCRDYFHRHRIKLTLEILISNYLTPKASYTITVIPRSLQHLKLADSGKNH